MTKKNAWNKEYETTERNYRAKDESGKWHSVYETLTVLAKPGMKADQKEIAFGKIIKKMKPDKPKAFSGDWTKIKE